MKTVLLALACLTVVLRSSAADTPRGTVLELHSCELYAGGCTVSAEATQAGRYLLRVWDFAGGKASGAELKGLQVAVLQSSPDNLASPISRTGDAVVYLPQAANEAQRAALLNWVQSRPDFKPARTFVKTDSLQFTKSANTVSVSIGKQVSLQTKPLEACDSRSCGEELWYEPRSATEVFTVAVNRASMVSEPLLKLDWKDSGQRSVFLGRFGESSGQREIFVSMNEVCGGWL